MIDKPRATILQLKHAVLGLVENVPFIKYTLDNPVIGWHCNLAFFVLRKTGKVTNYRN